MQLRLKKFDLSVVYKPGTALNIADFFVAFFVIRVQQVTLNVKQITAFFSVDAEVDMYKSFESVNYCKSLKISGLHFTQVCKETCRDTTFSILKRIVLRG